MTFLCLQLHSFAKRKLEVPPQQRLLRAADLFCIRAILQLATKTNTPNTTCRSKTCPSPTICQLTNVVYEATCTLCQQTYIGQTRRELHDRIREHTYAARKHDNTSAFGEHYANTHPNTTTPNITFNILKRTSDTLRLHIEEAYAIQTKSPQLNRRDERLGMGFLI